MKKKYFMIAVSCMLCSSIACNGGGNKQQEIIKQSFGEDVVNSDGWLNHLVTGIYKRSDENCITTVTLENDEDGDYTIEIVNDITEQKTTVIDELYSVFDDLGDAYGVGRDSRQNHETILSKSVIDTNDITTQGYGCTYTPENGDIMLYIASLSDGSLYLSTTSEGNNSVINQTGSEYGIQFMNGYFNEVSDMPY